MSVAKYQIFLKTVECGSFTAAAREMNFTQSGVSHAIGSLEEELGVPLLIRSHGGVTPTADGRALLPYFEKMCAMQHQLEQQAADLRGLETGLVKVATFTSVSEKWLPNILKTFQTHYPHIEFELLPSNFNSEIGNWVLNGRADCGFISLPALLKSIWTAGFSSGTSGRSSSPATTRWRVRTPSRLRRWSSIP